MSTTRRTIAIFWRANMQHPALFIGTMVLWIVGMSLQKLGVPFIVAHAIAKLIEPQATITWGEFIPYIAGTAILVFVSQGLIDAALLLLSRLEVTVRPILQNRVFDMLVRQSMSFHANSFSGSLVNQANRFVTAHSALTNVFVINVLLFVVNVLFAIIIITVLAWPIGLAMLVWAVGFVAVNIVMTNNRSRLSKQAAAADSVLTAHLADVTGNIAAVKAFGNESVEAATHAAKSLDRSTKRYATLRRATKNDIVLGTLMGILQVGMLTLSTMGVMNDAIDIPTLLLIQVYVTQLIGLLWGLSGLTRGIEQNLSDSAEMTELLDQTILVQDAPKPQRLRIAKGAITFNNVSFTHGDNSQSLFSSFNLSIKPGEKIGLVGHSGAGKSSLTSLLLRFVDVDGGSIGIDGQNIANVRQTELRRAIAYVPQEPLLFHRSLRENIAYGNPEATDAEITHAARQAHAADFIEQLPNAYQTLVGERGVKLSGGQRQRIAIARAILKDAPILVLDEATSALDSESEKLIQDALAKLMKNRTTIVIAHRLSTIQRLDRIVVLAEGRIIEEGKHADLLASDGTYAELWAHQSGGFIGEGAESSQPASPSSSRKPSTKTIVKVPPS